MKNRLIKYFLLSSLFCSLPLYAKSQYIPSHLDQFRKTGICVGCDLSEANLPSYDNANLANALLVKAYMPMNHYYTSNFTNAKLMYANMNMMSASGSNFSGADLTGASLQQANLSSCNFEGANFTGVNLKDADLAWAKISKKQLAQASSISCAILPDGSKSPSDNSNHC